MPRVLHDGVPCHFPIRKVLALTLYLAVTGQSHRRATLVAMFWPDADEARGLQSLRQALLRMRQALGADADTHLVSTGDLVRLDLGAQGSLDVAQLSTAATREASPEERAAALRTWEGPFFEHLLIDDAPDFMEWVSAQRAHWDACFDRTAEQEVRRLIDDGRADEASALGQTWLVRRPESEAAYRVLATAQATAGDVAGAEQTVATAERRWVELGLDPAAETQALRAQLAALPALTPPPAPPHVLRLPFVGRREAMTRLRQSFQQAQTGSVRAALVLGEAGVGKSRLLRAFMRWAAVQSADVALGRADELSARLPYQPLMDLLRERLARERAPDDLLEDSWLIELQRLVPDLHDRYPDLPHPVDDAAAGARLLEAIAQLGLSLARHRPLLWLLDDLHWADEATRDGLLYLLRRWRDAQAHALLVCTMRSEEIAADPALERWIATAQRTTAVSEVTLTPLSAEMTTQAVTTLFAQTASPELCTWLQEITEGNPLYLEHVVQALVERGAAQWYDDTPHLAGDVEVAALTGWLPDTLRGLLLRSVRRLDPAAQQTLAAAAALGTRFDEGALMQVAGVEEEAVLAALEVAERRQLIRADAGAYRFAHDKVAEAVYGDLSLARRRVFHRRALRAREMASAGTGMGTASAAELARHALAAEDWEAAARYLRQAGEGARQIGAYRDAVRQYEQVVQLLVTPPSQQTLWSRLPEGEIAQIYGQLGLDYALLGEKERARAVYTHLLAEARTRAAPVLEGRALEMLGRLALEFDHDTTAAQSLLEEAQRVAEQAGDFTGQVQATRRLALLALDGEHMPQAREYAQQAVRLARRSPNPRDLPVSLNISSDVEMWSGQWAAACAAAEESVVLLATAMDETKSDARIPYQFASPMSWATFLPRIAALLRSAPTDASSFSRLWGANGLMGAGIGRLHLGEDDTGRAALEMACQIFGERNEQRFLHLYLLHTTLGWIEAGDYEHAARKVEQVMAAIQTAAIRPMNPTDVRPLCAVVDVSHALWKLDEASEPLEQASAFAPGKPTWERLLPATRWTTQHALAGDWAAAHAATLHAQALRDAAPSPLTWFDFARYYETEALLRAGDRARAEADVRRLSEHLGANRRYRLMYLRMQALLDRDTGEHTAAIGHLLEALDWATQMGLPGEEWQIAAELSASYIDAGDAAHAAEARRRADRAITALAARITDRSLGERFTRAALAQLPALRHAVPSSRPLFDAHPNGPHRVP
jgi:DNA-binding SARP family transcriptional activator/tetratricopeptide (TPR) repeat protein